MKHQELAEQIVAKVGGAANVSDVSHCVTRLRFTLKDPSLAHTSELQSMSKVLGVVQAGGQYQVVIGNEVPSVYEAVTRELGGSVATASPAKRGFSPREVLNTFASLFTPLVPALAGSGIIKGLLVLATYFGWLSKESGAYVILTAASDAVFYFIPMLLAYTCAKRFKADPVVSIVIAGSLLFPPLLAYMKDKESIDFLSVPVVVTSYASTVIPIILAILVYSRLEHLLDRVLPGPVRLVFTPAISLLVMVPLTLMVFGPFGSFLSREIGEAFTWVTGLSPLVAGAIFGGTYPLLVMFGMHRALVPIGINEVATAGRTALWAFTGPSNFADAGASLAVALRVKNKAMRSVAISASITALCGITEPALYGVNLVYKRPMVGVLTGGAVGGAIAGAGGAYAYAVAIPSVLSIPAFFGAGFVAFVIAITVAFAIGFALTLILGIKEEVAGGQNSQDLVAADEVEPVAAVTSAPATVTVHAPVSGEVAPVGQATDPAFAGKMLGDGALIRPDSDILVAPVDGVVVSLFPTHHALGIRTDDGADVLIHIGVNTVKLQGQHFTATVAAGDRVRTGQQLVEFDRAAIQAAGYSTETFVVLSNPDFGKVRMARTGHVKAGDDLFTVQEPAHV